MTAPANAQLPGGGGYQICDVYDVVQSKFGQTTNVVSRAPTENGNQSEVYNGFDVVLNIRLARRRQHQWRVEHRPDRHQQLRADADQPAVRKRQHTTYPGPLRDHAAMVGIDAGQVLRGVPAAVGFPGRDDLPESARHHVWRQRDVHQCAGCAVARPQPVGGAERHRHDSADCPEHALRRSHPANRLSILTDVPHLEHAHRAAVRHLQRVQRQPDSRRQQYLRLGVADADADSGRPLVQVRDAGDILNVRRGRRGAETRLRPLLPRVLVSYGWVVGAGLTTVGASSTNAWCTRVG